MPPEAITCSANSPNIPPLVLTLRTLSFVFWQAIYLTRSVRSSSCSDNCEHTLSHRPQFTHESTSTTGYRNPSPSRCIDMQFFGQALAHAVQPQHFVLSDICIIFHLSYFRAVSKYLIESALNFSSFSSTAL